MALDERMYDDILYLTKENIRLENRIDDLIRKNADLEVENDTLQALVDEYEKLGPVDFSRLDIQVGEDNIEELSQLDTEAGRDELAREVDENLGLPQTTDTLNRSDNFAER